MIPVNEDDYIYIYRYLGNSFCPVPAMLVLVTSQQTESSHDFFKNWFSLLRGMNPS